MKNLIAAFSAELIKLKRSKVLFVTVGFYAFISLMMGLMMYLAQHPEMASRLGLVAAKTSFFEENSWKGFFNVINQIVAILGIIGFGFVTAWVFGREYIEHTLTDILALPVSRVSIVIAKFLVILIWCLLLVLVLFFTSLLIGYIIHIPDAPIKVIVHIANKYFLTSILTLLLITPVAFIASAGRGIIAPIGFAIVTLILAQFAALIGLGPYFPWAIPGIYTVDPGTPGMELGIASYIILAVTSIAGFISAIVWWLFADQH